MGKNTAKIIAALGAGAVGFQQGAKMKQDLEERREDRQWKRQEREQEQAYRSERQALAQRYTQELAASEDPNVRRTSLMRLYEDIGGLDAKYGKAGVADMEALRKTTSAMKEEGQLDAYGHYLTTGDVQGTVDRFNQVGKKKIKSLQPVEDVEPLTGQKIVRFTGEFEDGSKFGYNPYQEARKLGGVAGLMATLKEKAAAEAKDREKADDREFELKKIDRQGQNQARVANIQAADSNTKAALMRQQEKERKDLSQRFAEAQARGDTAEMQRLTILAHGVPGARGEGKLEVKTDDFGGITVVDGRKLTRIDQNNNVIPINLNPAQQPQGAGSAAAANTGKRAPWVGGVSPGEKRMLAAKAVVAGKMTFQEANAELQMQGIPPLPPLPGAR